MVRCRWVLPSQKVLLNGAVLDQWFSQGIPRPRHCLGVCYRTHFRAQTSRIRYFVANENEPPQAVLMLGFRSHPINHTCINLSQRGTVHWVSIHPGPIDQGRRLDSGAHLDPTCFQRQFIEANTTMSSCAGVGSADPWLAPTQGTLAS